MVDTTVSRRTLLRGVGGGLAGTSLVGHAAAGHDDDRYVIGLEVGGAAAAIRHRADSIDRELEFGELGIAITGRFSPAAVAALERASSVRYVEPLATMHALGQTTPEGIARIEADVAIDAGETGAGVDVAIVDTGIDADHEDLASNLGTGGATSYAACSSDCGSTSCRVSWDDDHGHGTHVAGTVGAIDDGTGVVGVSPAITLHAVKVLRCDGSGRTDDIAAGIRWATDQGHDVINLSLGGTRSSVIRDAVRYAHRNGVVLVAATGNEGCSDCVSYPAAYDEVIAVSATDDRDALASFSSTGPEVDIAAPGATVLSTLPGDEYGRYSGTSMACPHVAGAAASLLAAGYDPRAVRDRLLETAEDVGLEADEAGAGRLNVADALGLGDGDGGESDGGDGNEDGGTDDGSSDDDSGTDDGDDADGGDGDDSEPSGPVVESVSVDTDEIGPLTFVGVDWSVADGAGGLESVTTELLDGGRVVDEEASVVSGSSASGTHDVYTWNGADSVRLTVVSEAGEITETESL